MQYPNCLNLLPHPHFANFLESVVSSIELHEIGKLLSQTIYPGRMKVFNVIASKVQTFNLVFVFDFGKLLEAGDVVVFDAEMLELLELFDVIQGLELCMVYGQGVDVFVPGGNQGQFANVGIGEANGCRVLFVLVFGFQEGREHLTDIRLFDQLQTPILDIPSSQCFRALPFVIAQFAQASSEKKNQSANNSWYLITIYMSKKEEKAQEIPGPRKTPDSSVEGYQHPEQVEPRTITPSRFLQYQSIELKRLDNTFVRLRRSLPYLGGCLFLGLLLANYYTGQARKDLFGQNRNGGQWLTLYSRNTDADMAYNREFQRNRYLTEDLHATKDYLNSEQQLAKLGIVKTNIVSTPGYDRRAPHPKYYY